MENNNFWAGNFVALDLVVFLFSAIIILSVVKILLRGDSDDTLKKVVGGVSVFLVSLIADNTIVYALAFFIGGLLIATERFLLFLASMFRASKKDIKAISGQYSELTRDEVQDNRMKEAEATVKQESENKDLKREKIDTKITKQETEKTQTIIKNIEQQVLTKVRQLHMSNKNILKKHVKIKDNGANKVYDGVVIEKNTNIIKAAIEIKYFKEIKSNAVDKYINLQAPKLNSYNFWVVFVLVFSNYDHERANELLDIKKSFYKKHEAGLVFYHYNNGDLEVINDHDLDLISVMDEELF